jgi:hypothetical protein
MPAVEDDRKAPQERAVEDRGQRAYRGLLMVANHRF